MSDDTKNRRRFAGNLKAAIAGAAALLFQGTATAGTLSPIVNRARDRYAAEVSGAQSNTPEQLLMQPAGDLPTSLAHGSHKSHSSHSSHSSHRSHYSSSVAPLSK
jgi:hypothetical protein